MCTFLLKNYYYKYVEKHDLSMFLLDKNRTFQTDISRNIKINWIPPEISNISIILLLFFLY